MLPKQLFVTNITFLLDIKYKYIFLAAYHLDLFYILKHNYTISPCKTYLFALFIVHYYHHDSPEYNIFMYRIMSWMYYQCQSLGVLICSCSHVCRVVMKGKMAAYIYVIVLNFVVYISHIYPAVALTVWDVVTILKCFRYHLCGIPCGIWMCDWSIVPCAFDVSDRFLANWSYWSCSLLYHVL